MLLPTEEETAISPNPFLATITLVMRSGIEVPAARNVNPITLKEKILFRKSNKILPSRARINFF